MKPKNTLSRTATVKRENYYPCKRGGGLAMCLLFCIIVGQKTDDERKKGLLLVP